MLMGVGGWTDIGAAGSVSCGLLPLVCNPRLDDGRILVTVVPSVCVDVVTIALLVDVVVALVLGTVLESFELADFFLLDDLVLDVVVGAG
jgi:hypothetical protein